mgnify:CR=1 FL=1|jgi:hypothetical protein|tara:strand:+ start:5881 stop:6351 length:471 start_codon:yes stop_codon:yes gene_type:complete
MKDEIIVTKEQRFEHHLTEWINGVPDHDFEYMGTWVRAWQNVHLQANGYRNSRIYGLDEWNETSLRDLGFWPEMDSPGNATEVSFYTIFGSGIYNGEEWLVMETHEERKEVSAIRDCERCKGTGGFSYAEPGGDGVYPHYDVCEECDGRRWELNAE